jgi:hypothetical protein
VPDGPPREEQEEEPEVATPTHRQVPASRRNVAGAVPGESSGAPRQEGGARPLGEAVAIGAHRVDRRVVGQPFLGEYVQCPGGLPHDPERRGPVAQHGSARHLLQHLLAVPDVSTPPPEADPAGRAPLARPAAGPPGRAATPLGRMLADRLAYDKE